MSYLSLTWLDALGIFWRELLSKDDAALIQMLCEKGFFNKQHLQHAIEKHVDHEVLLLLQKYLK